MPDIPQDMPDVFLYSGSIERGDDWKFIDLVSKSQSSSKCIVIMVSGGGNPDAAYKMSRYLLHKYDSYSVLVSGICKSAATLFAIGANELVFCPFGELGPLDIQLEKQDQVTRQESGLNISEAFLALEQRAEATFNKLVRDQIDRTRGVVSFQTASDIATAMVSALYGPIFAQIDPEEVGSRTRAMRIGEEYAARLNLSANLKPKALEYLTTFYSSHSFVIDYAEAQTLFHRVRLATELELALVDKYDYWISRFPAEPNEKRNALIELVDAPALPKSEKTNARVGKTGTAKSKTGSSNKNSTGTSKKGSRTKTRQARRGIT